MLRSGVLAWRQADLKQVQDRLEERLALGKDLDNPSLVAVVLNNLGNVAREGGAHDDARASYEQSLALRRQFGESRGRASCLNNLGIPASDRGDLDEAWAEREESIAVRRALGDHPGIALSLQNLGEVALRRGDPLQARALYSDSLTMFRDLAEPVLVTRNLEALARVAEATGAPVSAARLFGAAASPRNMIKRAAGIDRQGALRNLASPRFTSDWATSDSRQPGVKPARCRCRHRSRKRSAMPRSLKRVERPATRCVPRDTPAPDRRGGWSTKEPLERTDARGGLSAQPIAEL